MGGCRKYSISHLCNGAGYDKGYYDGLIGSRIRTVIYFGTKGEAMTVRYKHTRFRLTPKSVTLNDLERPKRTLAEKTRLTEPTRKT